MTRQFSALADTQTMRTAAAGFRLARFEEARDQHRARIGNEVIRRFAAAHDEVLAGVPRVTEIAPPSGRVAHHRAVEAAAVAAMERGNRPMLFHGFPMVMEYGYETQAADAMLALVRHLGETASGTAPSRSP